MARPDGDARSDGELVAAARRGDRGALDALYQRHSAWVLRAARRFAGDETDALDVHQEVFLYLVRRLPTLTLTVRLTTLLYPAIRSRGLRARERREREVTGGDHIERATDAPIEARPSGRQLADAVRALPEGQREAILLRFVDGLSVEATAEAMGVPEGTVKSRVHHGLAALREDPRARSYFLDED